MVKIQDAPAGEQPEMSMRERLGTWYRASLSAAGQRNLAPRRSKWRVPSRLLDRACDLVTQYGERRWILGWCVAARSPAPISRERPNGNVSRFKLSLLKDCEMAIVNLDAAEADLAYLVPNEAGCMQLATSTASSITTSGHSTDQSAWFERQTRPQFLRRKF